VRNGSSLSRVPGGKTFPEAGKLLPPALGALDRSGPVPEDNLDIRERGPRKRLRKLADASLDDWPDCGQ